MIGVVASPSDLSVVHEFFQLFKTPWELYRRDRQYDVLLCCGDMVYDPQAAKFVLLYSGHELASDAAACIAIAGRHQKGTLSHDGTGFPIYGFSLTFEEETRKGQLRDEASGNAASFSYQSQYGTVVRIGYDLFHEIRALLTVGQPVEYAGIPTLELHIAFLRDSITSLGVMLLEIPPVPDGYRFIVCLTHDVDHPSIRAHKCDHTALGFLYRALVGTARDFIKGSIPLRDAWTSWAAVLRLPLVYLGLAKDFWSDFAVRYRNLEKDLPSTYFVIPFRDRPGRTPEGTAPAYRAAGYDADDVSGQIADVVSAGCEVGLHGIDAWTDNSSACEELQEIRRVSGCDEIGVRMHWLYFDEHSPAILERADAAYDSTIGYRETVGYRAGTSQTYKPLQAERLLELPLHVMDTALFYPAYLGLSSQQATTVLRELTDQVESFGGCLTINWHDRSLAPERLWYACYARLLEDLKARGAWFATVGQAVAWFRKRRSVVFEPDDPSQALLANPARSADHDKTPGLCLRIHNETSHRGRSKLRGCVEAPLYVNAAADLAHATGK